MSVSCDFDQVGCDGIVDELIVFGYELVQAFLDNLICQAIMYLTNEDTYVVTVEILDEGDDVHGKSVNQGPDLLGLPWRSEEINHLLNSTSTVHIERNANKVISDRFDNSSSLFVRRVFK